MIIYYLAALFLHPAQQFSVECEHCHASVPVTDLATHEVFFQILTTCTYIAYIPSLFMQALCDSNPSVHLKKFPESQPPSSATALGHNPSLSSNGATSSLTSSSTSGRETEPGAAAASPTLLSVEKGPCEYCHQVIPLAQLIGHEVNTREPLHHARLISSFSRIY